jgi:hypothetical protein
MSFAEQAFNQRHVLNPRGKWKLKIKAEKSTKPAHLRGKVSVQTSPQLAGFPPETGHPGPEPDPANVRPLSMQWLSDERIAEAHRVWSKAYARVISVDEAVEILMNVRRLAEVLLRAEQEENQP